MTATEAAKCKFAISTWDAKGALLGGADTTHTTVMLDKVKTCAAGNLFGTTASVAGANSLVASSQEVKFEECTTVVYNAAATTNQISYKVHVCAEDYVLITKYSDKDCTTKVTDANGGGLAAVTKAVCLGWDKYKGSTGNMAGTDGTTGNAVINFL